MILMLCVNDVIWVTSNNSRLFGPDGPGTVTKRGRVYATVKWNGREYKYTLATHSFKGNAYGETITAYANREAHLHTQAIERAWHRFHSATRGMYYHKPPSLEGIAQARALLGLPPDPEITTNQTYPTFDE